MGVAKAGLQLGWSWVGAELTGSWLAGAAAAPSLHRLLCSSATKASPTCLPARPPACLPNHLPQGRERLPG